MKQLKHTTIICALAIWTASPVFADEQSWKANIDRANAATAKRDWTALALALEAAVKDARSLGELDPRHEKTVLRLASCYRLLKLDVKACRLYEEAIRIRSKRRSIELPSDFELYTRYSRLLKSQNKEQAAHRAAMRAARARQSQFKALTLKQLEEGARNTGYRFRANVEHRELAIDRILSQTGYQSQKRSSGSLHCFSPLVVSLMRGYEHGSIEVRSFSVEILKRLGADAALAYHFLESRRAQEQSSRVRMYISMALRKIPRPEFNERHCQGAISELRSEDPVHRRYAVHLLGSMPIRGRAAVPDLLLSLRDSNARVRSVSIHALGKICRADPSSWPVVVPAFKRILNGPDSELAAEVAVEWGRQAHQGPARRRLLEKRICQFTATAAPHKQLRLISALGQLGAVHSESIKTLLSTVHSDDPRVRAQTIKTLLALPLALDVKAQILAKLPVEKAHEQTVRQALISMGNNSYKPMLSVLRSAPRHLHPRAVFVLKRLYLSTSALIRMLTDQCLSIRVVAAERLETSYKLRVGKALISILVMSLGDESSIVRGASALALGEIQTAVDKPVIRSLLKLLNDKDGRVRWRAVRALGKVGKGDPAVLEALQAMTTDPSRRLIIELKLALKMLKK
jgi:HEAT repeat protein